MAADSRGIKLIPVPTSEVEVWWELVLPLMKTFFERVRGRYEPHHVVEALQKGDMQLWVVMREHSVLAACMTEVMRFPCVKEFRIIQLTGSDYELWVGLLSKLEDYAKCIGCDKIIGIARPGWEKVIKTMGYEKTHVYLEKDLK